MSKHCAITGKATVRGNNVSHARNRTGRCFRANLHYHRFVIPGLGTRKMYVSRRGLSQIVKKGGLAELLRNTCTRNLGPDGQKLKKDLERCEKKANKEVPRERLELPQEKPTST